MTVEVITAIGEHIVTPIILGTVVVTLVYFAYKAMK